MVECLTTIGNVSRERGWKLSLDRLRRLEELVRRFHDLTHNVLRLHVTVEDAGGDIVTVALFEMFDEVAGADELALAPWAGDVLIGGMCLRLCQHCLVKVMQVLTYLLTMPLPPTEALEVFTAEFAGNMLQIVVNPLHLAGNSLNVRRHVLNLVSGEVLPVFGIKVALFAVEVVRIVFLVQLHLLQGVEHVLAAFLIARKTLLLVRPAGCTAIDGGIRNGNRIGRHRRHGAVSSRCVSHD